MILGGDSKFFPWFNVRWSPHYVLEITIRLSVKCVYCSEEILSYLFNVLRIRNRYSERRVRRREVEIVEYFSLHCSKASGVSTKINPFYVKAT